MMIREHIAEVIYPTCTAKHAEEDVNATKNRRYEIRVLVTIVRHITHYSGGQEPRSQHATMGRYVQQRKGFFCQQIKMGAGKIVGGHPVIGGRSGAVQNDGYDSNPAAVRAGR